MKVFLVTGGAGFIGSNYIKYMFRRYGNDIRVINIDKLTYAGNLANLKDIEKFGNYHFIKGDICDSDLINSVFVENRPNFVVNFAAESHVDRSIAEPEIFIRTNVLGTQVLLNAALQYGVEKFHQVSTDEVYGSLGEEGYFTEQTPLSPHSPYSASKAGADLLVQAYFDTYQLPINITRCSNNYGPYQFPEKLIPLMINNCLKKKKLPIYGTGMNIRDWLYVEDHCQAIDLVISKAEPGKVFNVGGNNELKNIDIVKKIIQIIAEVTKDDHISDELISYVQDRKSHDWRYAIDASLIRQDLGWEPRIIFNEGIYSTINWYLENKEWLDTIVSGEYQSYYVKFYENRK